MIYVPYKGRKRAKKKGRDSVGQVDGSGVDSNQHK